MSRTARSSSEGSYCGRAVNGVSNLSLEDMRQIEAMLSQDRPVPMSHIARQKGVNELDLRQMFRPAANDDKPVAPHVPSSTPTRPTPAKREERFRELWLSRAPRHEIAFTLGMCISAMDRMRRRLGLDPRKNGEKPKGWRAAEDQFIRDEYATRKMTAEQVAAVLGRTRNAVIGRASRAGLTRKHLRSLGS